MFSKKTTDFVLKTTDEEFVVFFLWRQITYQTNSVIICDENELRQRKQLSLYSKGDRFRTTSGKYASYLADRIYTQKKPVFISVLGYWRQRTPLSRLIKKATEFVL